MSQASDRFLRVFPWLLFLSALVLYLGVFKLQVDRNPLRGDEVDFFQCMRNVNALGRPLYYAGEIRVPVASVQPLGSETLAGQHFQFYRFKPETGILKEPFYAVTAGTSRYTYCLWHPPLYVYLGALFLRVFDLPTAEASLFRYTHLLYVLLMFAGLAALMRELYPSTWFLGFSLTMLSLASSRLTVAASSLIDYNGALAMSVVVWLVWALLVADRHSRAAPRVVILMALTFGVGLGVGTAVLLGLLLWSMIFHRSALLRHAFELLLGAALFVVVLWLVAQLARFPFSQPFLHNFQRAELPTPLSSRLLAIVEYTGWYVDEISLVAVGVALLLCILHLARQRAHHETMGAARPDCLQLDSRVLLLPTIVLTTVLSQAALRADAYGFPKYIAFALPLLFAFIGGELAGFVARGRGRWAAAAAVFLLIVSLLAQTADRLQQPGGTLYMAGEEGFVAAADAVAANTPRDEVFLGSKDLAFYANRKFIQWSGNLLVKLPLLEQRLANQRVQTLAASEGHLAGASSKVLEWLTEKAVVVTSPADFRVYRLP